MPLFMDRHEQAGATAEAVAEAHARDLELADEYGVQLLAYWFDAESGGTFCFAKASKPACTRARSYNASEPMRCSVIARR